MEKEQWNSIDKKQNGLKYSKNDKSSTLPGGLDLKYTKNMLATQCAWPSEWPFRNQHVGH